MNYATLTHDLMCTVLDDPTETNNLVRHVILPKSVVKVLTPAAIKLRDAGYIDEKYRGDLFDWLFEARMTTGQLMLILLILDTAAEEHPEMPLIMLGAMINVQQRYLATARKAAKTSEPAPELPKLFPVTMVTRRENPKPVPFIGEIIDGPQEFRDMETAFSIHALNIFIPDC